MHRYVVYRDGERFAVLGNTLSFGDTGTDDPHSYEVSAINSCGAEGPRSESVVASPLPGALVPAPVAPTNVAKSRIRTYKVLAPNGDEVGTRRWRTVTGLGNGYETHVGTDAAGRLYEYGGTFLFVSADAGETWSWVSNIVPALGGEGAVAGAPGGDVLAVNWSPYTADQVWAHKYVAATDTWYTARTPLHQAFHDRPWVAVIEGPFDVNGQLVPYVSLLLSNWIHGDLMMMSFDGLHYVVPTTHLLAAITVPVSSEFPPDPDRDWVQSIRLSGVYPLDDGIGLRGHTIVNGCGDAYSVLDQNLTWSCADWVDTLLGPLTNEVVRIDSAGAIHVTQVAQGARTIEHRVSRDGGKSWRHATATLPYGLLVEEWDVKVNAALDQVVVAAHASATTDHTMPDQDMVFRFTDIHDGIRLEEILLVGDGNYVYGSYLGSTAHRFDYTTVALLPSGRAVVSFGDGSHVPVALAIEMD